MQDYNYVWFGCMEVTLEISCCKYPPAKELPTYWEDNKLVYIHIYIQITIVPTFCLTIKEKEIILRDFVNCWVLCVVQALIKFLAEAHRGIQGFVIDENGNPIEKASLKVKGRDVGFQTTKYGEFWRILLPGIYKLEVRLLY